MQPETITETSPVAIVTLHGYTASFIPDHMPDGNVQFAYNGRFRFAIPMVDLCEIVEKLKEKQ